MKFGKKFKQGQVPEWHSAYLNYNILKKLLGPYKAATNLFIKTKFENGEENMVLVNYRMEDLAKLKNFGNQFEKILIIELDKINIFYQFKLMDCMRKHRYLKKNLQFMKERRLHPNFSDLASKLKFGFHQFFKELKLLDEYVKINQKAIDKLIKKHNKSLKLFDDRNYNEGIHLQQSQSYVQKLVKKRIRDSYINRNNGKLQNIIKDIEKSYVQFFYTNFNKRQGEKEIRGLYDERKGADVAQLFYFGLFLGFSIVLLFYIILELSIGNPNQSDKMSTYLLIQFRGLSLFILYMWLLGWNVYGWNSFNVNYKLIFKFNHHFSTVQQILKRAAIFTLILLIMFLIFYTQNVDQFNIPFFPKTYAPLVCWTILFGYIFFPSYQIFNGQGRKYFYNLIYLCLFTVFYPMEFRISWATDQSVSFVGPLKDLEFSLCFYSSDFANVDQNGTNLDLQHCNNDQNIMSGFIIAFLPLFFRMLQCLRQGYDNKKFIGTEFMWNFGKYTCSTMTATFSYLYKLYDHHIFFGFWMFFASSSVLYSYYWDLKHDWGFLEPNSKFKILRNKLAYHNPNIYYFVMINNLILRCTWVLSISPNTALALGFHNKLLFTFMISFLEMFRRCQWNFLRVEKEHIKNQMAYKAVEDLSLPVNIMLLEQKFQKQILKNDNLDDEQIDDQIENQNKLNLVEENSAQKELNNQIYRLKNINSKNEPLISQIDEDLNNQEEKYSKASSNIFFDEKNSNDKNSYSNSSIRRKSSSSEDENDVKNIKLQKLQQNKINTINHDLNSSTDVMFGNDQGQEIDRKKIKKEKQNNQYYESVYDERNQNENFQKNLLQNKNVIQKQEKEQNNEQGQTALNEEFQLQYNDNEEEINNYTSEIYPNQFIVDQNRESFQRKLKFIQQSYDEKKIAKMTKEFKKKLINNEKIQREHNNIRGESAFLSNVGQSF